MKIGQRIISLLIATILGFTCFSVVPVTADESKAAPNSGNSNSGEFGHSTKKVVSVLFDNSGSMHPDFDNISLNNTKNNYALYALQMLIAMLGNNDEMVIVPMNIDRSANTGTGIQVDLSADRQSEINRIITSTVLSSPPNGGTPASSMKVAIDQLVKAGLKDDNNLASQEDGVEYWFVILTDGEFSTISGVSAPLIGDKIEHYIDGYSSLKTIFFGFGSEFADLSDSDEQMIKLKSLAAKNVSTYRATTSDGIASEMQKISNILLGRFGVDSNSSSSYKYYSISADKKTVTIDLNHNKVKDMSFKSISVIAQDSGMTKMSYNYSGGSIVAVNSCSINPNATSFSPPDDRIDMKSGFSTTLRASSSSGNNNQFLNGGKITLTFDLPIDERKFSILAEPALLVEPIYKHNGNVVTADWINANLKPGKSVSVEYAVKDPTSGKDIDIASIFGTQTSAITYNSKTYSVGQAIELVQGNNALNIEISLMNGSYKIYASDNICILSEPTSFKVEADHSDFGTGKNASATYKVYYNNSPVIYNDIRDSSKFQYDVIVTKPDGSMVPLASKVGNDGTISADIVATDKLYGDYSVAFTVRSQELLGISRKDVHVFSYHPTESQFKIENVTSSNDFNASGQAKLEYYVQLDGVRLDKNKLADYDLTFSLKTPKGQDREITPTIANDGKITLNVESTTGVYGTYKATLTVSAPFGATRTDVTDVNCITGSFVISSDSSNKFDANGNASVAYKLSIDGKQITKDEIAANYNLTLSATDSKGNNATTTYTLSNDGTVNVKIVANPSVFGDYTLSFSAESKHDSTINAEVTDTFKNLPGGGSSGTQSMVTVTVDGFTGSCDLTRISEWTYKALLNGKQLSATDLNDYNINITAVGPDGAAATVEQLGIDAGGNISIRFIANDGAYGDYTVNFTVEYKYASEMNGSDERTVSYTLPALDIREEHSDKITTGDLDAALSYKIFDSGNQLNATDLQDYSVTIKVTAPDGAVTNLNPTIGTSGTISAEVCANARGFGHYKVDFTVTSNIDVNLTVTKSYVLCYHPETVEILSEIIGGIGNGVSNVDIQHTVVVEGVQMDAAELNKFAYRFEAKGPDDIAMDISTAIEDDGRITSSMDVSATGFGLYNSEFLINFCGDVDSEELADCAHIAPESLKFYPNSIEIKMITTDLSFSEYELTQNTAENKVVKFELYADGSPFAWNNGLTQFELTVAGCNVSANAIVEGNVLTYVPHSNELGELTAGEYELSVKLTCDEVPTIAVSKNGKLTVTKTTYKIITLDLGGKTVDRFDLNNLDAALYFQVLRDSVPLSVEELQAELGSGKININDNSGVFGWQFWLPVGNNVAVEEMEGNPVIVFKVTKDWIPPFDTFFAMFMFNGENTVTLNYRDVSGTDSIAFSPSGAWSYIWRILVILFVVHTILYIVGFFNGKCKNHSKGMIVSAMISTDTGKITFKVKTKINMKPQDIIAWHALRFVPNKNGYLWYHQPCKDGPSPSKIGFDDKGNFGLFFKNNAIYRINIMIDTPFVEALNDMKTKLRKYNGKGVAPMVKDFKGYEVREAFDRDFDDLPIPKNTRVDVGSYYGKYDSTGKLTGVIFFVRSI